MSKKNYYMGQKVLFKTLLFGKPYFWMQDGDGVIYLAKAKRNKGYTVASTGERSEYTQEWVPDFS